MSGFASRTPIVTAKAVKQPAQRKCSEEIAGGDGKALVGLARPGHRNVVWKTMQAKQEAEEEAAKAAKKKPKKKNDLKKSLSSDKNYKDNPL